MFEAREFLRKKLVGHQVQVTVDYVQAARSEPGQGTFPEKFCCTVMIGGVNVAEALVSKGLATTVRYAAGNDERSGKYDELLQAEEKAKKTGKGLHDKKNAPTHRVSDMTGKLEKCKQFLPFLKRAGRMQGLVEYVASGSRFRVYIPRETCIVTFLLGGISCPKGGRTLPDGTKVEAEKFGDECLAHVKEMVLQREVEIEVESQDKAGNFIGYLFVEGNNLSVHLVTEGFASMHFTADRSNYCNQIQNGQDNAKGAQKKIWKDYVEKDDPVVAEEAEKKELDAERKVSYIEAYVSEVTSEGKFYACTVSDGAALETLMEGLR
jgi:staphylococcal nuclease domain-containing protein 1